MDKKTVEARELFSRRLAAVLKKKDMKQKEVAAALGISEAAVGKWVLKKSMPRTMGQIQRLADFLGVAKSYFLDENANEDGIINITLTGDTHRQVTPPDGARLAAILRQLQTTINAAFDRAIYEALNGDGYTSTGNWSLDRQAVEKGSGNCGTA